jgi:hypothetical protein
MNIVIDKNQEPPFHYGHNYSDFSTLFYASFLHSKLQITTLDWSYKKQPNARMMEGLIGWCFVSNIGI